MSNGKEPWHLRLVVSIITRVVFFVIGFFLVPVGSLVSYRDGSISPFTYYIMTPRGLWFDVSVGVLAAIFGPYIYESATEQGRGDLEEIRKNSRGGGPKKH
jgi:hypothetical protein